MRCLVVGIGNLGGPLAQLLAEAGHDVYGYDLRDDIEMPPGVLRVRKGVPDPDVPAEMYFYVVPTPSLEDGTYDTSMLETAVDRWFDLSAIHIVVSTVLPGDCDRIFASVGCDRYAYSPEFIRLGHVREDMMNPDFVLIGCDSMGISQAVGDKVEEVLRSVVALGGGTYVSPSVPFVRLSVVEAELAKIALNTYLCMKLSAANLIGEMAEKLGADGVKVCGAVGLDRRINNNYFRPGGAYGGPCLPRDTMAFNALAQRLGTTAELATAAEQINLRQPQPFPAEEGRGY